TAVTCLASAGTRVRGLEFACGLTGSLDWQSVQGWEEFDLSRLEKVTYDPEPDTGAMPNEEDDARQAAIAATNLSALFEKGQGSLRKIKIRGDCELIWPGEQTLNLPALRSLDLSFNGIHVRNLGSWLRHMPSLEYFRLAGCYATYGDLTSWLSVFDAIRDHPRNRDGIRIVFEQAVHNDGAEVTLDYLTNQYEETLAWYEDVQQGKVESDAWYNATEYIMLYMVGEVGYNASIRAWLQDEDEDEDDDENEDDDDDENLGVIQYISCKLLLISPDPGLWQAANHGGAARTQLAGLGLARCGSGRLPCAANAAISSMTPANRLKLSYRAQRTTTLHSIKKLQQVKLDGDNLDIPSVVAVSRYDIKPRLTDNNDFRRRIDGSVATLKKLLEDGNTIYGVTTGFGGSADTRTDRTEDLQSSLLQLQHYGILAHIDKSDGTRVQRTHERSHAMPSDWIKGTMLIRSNTIARGHSGVSHHVIETITALLKHGMTPVIPLRGSVSASGDLSPLSYIAGALTGSPDIYVQSEAGIITAQQALRELNLGPVILGPKEALGLINGSASSAAVASLAIYETHHVTILAQALTAMALEALMGSVGNYHPFIGAIRPHRGQVESGNIIRQFLRGSLLARGFEHDKEARQPSGLLYQDRYALRTASQWVGPQLEDLLLAHEQITTELNSTTDNPLIDIEGQTTHHGGNFQAASITSAMEKTRLSLQMIGKMLFAQCSEVINPMLNNGLPPNLAADEP
ncbi:MAG: hypothetical protein Q9192_007503, partial [Flavoplaca navasiana]